MLKKHLYEGAGHNELDRKNSWYFNVLVKEYGNPIKAEQAIRQSRDRIDPTFQWQFYRYK